jgi:response regulator NasT
MSRRIEAEPLSIPTKRLSKRFRLRFAVSPSGRSYREETWQMVEDEIQHLRVLIANERRDRLELLAQVVAGLGHEVIAREVDVTAVAAVTARERPDVALVGLGLSSQHALELIEQIVHESSCPVIALLSAEDPNYVREAAKRGVFAYLVDTTPEELQSAIDVTLQRFTEYHNLRERSGAAPRSSRRRGS